MDDRDPWGSYDDFPRCDWQNEVANNYTTLGYLDWVDHSREAQEDEREVNDGEG
jgi:hypothetical protein